MTFTIRVDYLGEGTISIKPEDNKNDIINKIVDSIETNTLDTAIRTGLEKFSETDRDGILFQDACDVFEFVEFVMDKVKEVNVSEKYSEITTELKSFIKRL